MLKQRVAWNRKKTASVVLAKLKEFTVEESAAYPGIWSVKGWYNETNSFNFGGFNSQQEAQDFLDLLHSMF